MKELIPYLILILLIVCCFIFRKKPVTRIVEKKSLLDQLVEYETKKPQHTRKQKSASPWRDLRKLQYPSISEDQS